MAVLKMFSVLAGAVSACICAAAQGNAEFKIGVPDGCAGEFKFFRNLDDTRFATTHIERVFRDVDGCAKFFANPPAFVVGKSKAEDWSFIHPAANCGWSGRSDSPVLKIEFFVDKPDGKDRFLKIGLADTAATGAIGLEVSLNGKPLAKKSGFYIRKDAPKALRKYSATLAYHRDAKNSPSEPFVAKIPADKIAAGKNVLELKAFTHPKARGEQWLVYDFLELSKSPEYPKIDDYKATLLPRALEAMGAEEVVFCISGGSRGGHWYENIGTLTRDDSKVRQCIQGSENFSRLGARLVKFNLKTREYKVLLEDARGGIRDLHMHYDAKKILFSYRKGDSDTFKLYEIGVDGKNLRRLPINTPSNDVEPCYLPNDDIMFVSDRMNRTVQCWMSPVTNLHRYFVRENAVRCMSGNPDVDNTPNVLHDGRVVYMRWDYNHRNQMLFHHLWAMNPDGSNNTIFYGNAFGQGVFLNARQFPDSDDTVFTLSPGHGMSNHRGAIALLRPPFDPSDPYAMKIVSPNNNKYSFYEPSPLKGGLILTTNGDEIVIMDTNGVLVKIPIPRELYQTSGESLRNVVNGQQSPNRGKCPMIARNVLPIAKRPRENLRPDMADFSKKTAQVFLQDVYEGRNMAGVKRGSVAKLMITQVQPAPVNFSGGSEPTGMDGSFAIEEVLGTVPVYEDGSAFFEVPALVAVAFTALDKDGNCVKRMMSSTNFAPATQTSCIGCHETRTAAPVRKQKLPIAYAKGAVKIVPAKKRIIDFSRDIQPMLDKYCVGCHNPRNPKGGIILSFGIGEKQITPRIVLQMAGMCATDKNKFGDFAPYSFGSGASRLARFAEGGHNNKRFSEAELSELKAWLDCGSLHISTYAAKGGAFPQKRRMRITENIFSRDNYPPKAVYYKRCAKCHETKETNKNVYFGYVFGGCTKMAAKTADGKIKVINFPRQNIFNFFAPEESPALIIPLAKSAGGYAEDEDRKSHPIVFADRKDPDYVAMLAGIKKIAAQYDAENPFILSKKFYPPYGYVKQMQKCGILPKDWDDKRHVDPYKIDNAYFRWQEKHITQKLGK